MYIPIYFFFHFIKSPNISPVQCVLADLLVTAVLSLIPTWIDNHIPNEVWDEITYPFPDSNDCAVEVWECISNFILHFVLDILIHAEIKVFSMSVKGSQVYYVECVSKIKPVLLVLSYLYIAYGIVCFQKAHFSFETCENIYTSSQHICKVVTVTS